jgi:hypothetical protein
MPDLISDEWAGLLADIIIIASAAAAAWYVIRRWLVPLLRSILGRGSPHDDEPPE